MSAFNEPGFEKKLLGLKDSQESISTLSDWCLQNRQHHKKIVATWLSVLKKVRVENRLTLFYLANDVVQYSKRKNYDFVESWGTALQKATTMVRHDKVIDRIMRIFKIWGERNVYSEEFLTDLRGLLTAKKATPATPQSAAKQPEHQATSASVAPGEFHQSVLFKRINKCKELEDDTDLKLKVVNDCKLINLNDLDAFRAMLKDRKHADGVAGDLDQAVQQVEDYTKALEVEILERKAVIDLLQQATKFYESEKSDAKTVFNAYRNFGSRVKSLKRKLDELIPTLSSPVPSPDVNAPSPSPDLDLDLPNDEDLTGIVELLEDIGDAPVEVDSDDDDLMSIISYNSSDEENPKFSYLELLHMPIHLRRRQLPLPNPAFSDSDLTELDDSIEDVDDSNNAAKDFKRLSSHVKTPSRASGMSVRPDQNLEGSLKSLNSAPGRESLSTPPSKSMQEVTNVSGSTESSTAKVFKEPVQKKICSLSDKPLKNIAEANCPLVNDAVRQASVQSSTPPVDAAERNISPVLPSKETKSLNIVDNSIANGTFFELGSDFLPSDEDLTGLLECLVDDPIETDAVQHAGCSTTVTKVNQAGD